MPPIVNAARSERLPSSDSESSYSPPFSGLFIPMDIRLSSSITAGINCAGITPDFHSRIQLFDSRSIYLTLP